jgi:iron complex outermembrane receptor protein
MAQRTGGSRRETRGENGATAGHRRTVLSTLAIAGALCGMTSAVAEAQETSAGPSAAIGAEEARTVSLVQAGPARRFDIPAQPLISALVTFSEMTELQLFFDATIARDLKAPAVAGTMTVEDALRRLLEGSGLAYRFTNASTVTLERRPPAGESGAVRLETVTVEGRIGTPPQATIGNLPEEYPGGQVARGSRIGVLGNKGYMDTPFNATSYTAKTIEDQQAQTIGDVLANDPSVRTVYQRGANTDEFMIRGFTLYNREVGFNGLHGIVPFSSVGLEGIERVEVLKGPNALLNGMAVSGSIGGGINLVPKRAGTEPLTRLTTSYISDSQLGAHIDVGRRVSGSDDSFGVRGNLAARGGDTSTDDMTQESRLGTLGLDYARDRVRLDADVGYQRRDSNAPPQLLFPGTVVPAIGAPDAGTNFAQPWTYLDTQEFLGVVRGELDVTSEITLFAAFGARYGEYDSLQSNWTVQNSQGLIRSNPFYNFSEYEARSAEAGVRARVQTGPVDHQLTLAASTVDMDTYMFTAALPPAIFSNLYRPVASAQPVVPSFGNTPLSNTVTLTSFAVADTLSILDERVQLTLGVREQRVETSNYNQTTGALTSSYDKSELTPALGLVVKPLHYLSLYANYIEGLSQGPTAPNSAVNAGEVFPPFVSEQYEVGAKLDLGRFGVTLSAFQIDQPSSFTNPTTLRFEVDGNQRHRGLELMTFGEVADGVRLLGGVAYTHAELTKTAGGVNDGKTGIGVPEIQANLGAEWDTPFLPGMTLAGRAIYTDSQYVNAANTQKIPDWIRFDAGVRYAFSAHGTPITVRFNVENVLDDGYWASSSRGGYQAGAPRTFLLSTSFDF